MNLKIRVAFIGIITAFTVVNTAVARKLKLKTCNSDACIFSESKNSDIKNDSILTLSIAHEYRQGDYIMVEGSKYLYIKLDQNISGSYVYAPNGRFTYPIPVNEIGENYSSISFAGKLHTLIVRNCSKAEWSAYRNLALNPTDVRDPSEFYPHATSNSECRSESWYAARNAIDGNTANTLHGKWPYQSWGPEMLDSLWFKIDFGRKVEVDKIVIYNRAQYYDNHDSYWDKAIIEFSDGTKEEIKIEKTALAQEIKLEKHNTSFVRFSGLKEFEHKWSAWIEVEVWGKDHLNKK